jgi:hypothetical protein
MHHLCRDLIGFRSNLGGGGGGWGRMGEEEEEEEEETLANAKQMLQRSNAMLLFHQFHRPCTALCFPPFSVPKQNPDGMTPLNDSNLLCCAMSLNHIPCPSLPFNVQARYASLLGKEVYPSNAGSATAPRRLAGDVAGYDRYTGRPGMGAYSYSEYV